MQLLQPHLRLVRIGVRHRCRICCRQISGACLPGSKLGLYQWCMGNTSAAVGSPSVYFKYRDASSEWLTMTFWECSNASSRLIFHIKCVSCLKRSRKGRMAKPSEYAQGTWSTSPNHNLASVSVFGLRKLNIALSIDLERVTLEVDIWRPPNCSVSCATEGSFDVGVVD